MVSSGLIPVLLKRMLVNSLTFCRSFHSIKKTYLMLKFILTGFSCLLLFSVSTAQHLYEPRNIKEAYQNDTRGRDGKPGSKYWQNSGRYSINVTALPPNREIRCSEKISYTNNSPETLTYLTLKLFLNIHKPGAIRNSVTGKDYLTDGIIIDSLVINGTTRRWTGNSYAGSWSRVSLREPLKPKDSAQLELYWHYDISLSSNREGMIDSTTYFFAYFYPRIAVYDDYNGWDYMDFTDQQEFYSDFNDYEVKITVPRDYLVWGTGTLLNADEVLQPDYASRFKRSLTSDQTVHVVTAADLKKGNITKAANQLTWSFRAHHVPDVAFGLSDHFVWDAGSVVVDDATGRRASVQAAFNDTAADYHFMVQFGQHALDWLSHNWPGIPYPYEKTTIFQGYAGMEYPMMANDETYGDTTFARFVAEHEIAHTYFPFYMGINETRYAFMDEGWATALEYLLNIDNMGKAKADMLFKQFRVAGWANTKSPEQDIPIITPADQLRNAAYGNNAYGKPALGYLALKEMLGDELFRKCLQGYMQRWNGKHPSPWDFFYSFNDISGRNLNWFWNSWFFSPNYIDLTVKSVSTVGSGYSVVINNTGGMPAPFDILLEYSDGSKETIHQDAMIWQRDPLSAIIPIKTGKKLSSLKLEGGIFMDANTADNSWTKK